MTGDSTGFGSTTRAGVLLGTGDADVKVEVPAVGVAVWLRGASCNMAKKLRHSDRSASGSVGGWSL